MKNIFTIITIIITIAAASASAQHSPVTVDQDALETTVHVEVISARVETEMEKIEINI